MRGTMTFENPPNEELRKLLREARVIAMVGASSTPDRPSHGIMQKLLGAGYRVIPVNPNEKEVLGQRAYAALADVPEKIDIVNVFRRPELTPDIAQEAVAVGAKALWLQVGMANDEAATTASAAGLTVVMDNCIGVTHALLGIPRRTP